MNPNQAERTFVPLVYHVAKTTIPEFNDLMKKGNAYARIDLGNVPSVPLPGFPVAVRAYAK